AGDIQVESEPGLGSSFRLTLPLQRCEEPVPSPEVETTAPLPNPARVLLVDDNEVNLKVARRYLEKLGCRVTTAADGQQALDTVSEHDFDLILMDCQMPVMTGIEATERIRPLKDRRAQRIFALTAMATPEEKEACLKAGMDGVITKPVRLDELRRVLTENQSS
ncbi:MAG: response regulator, partial [Candidatus Eremiobacteraeota bacterium]|nr:response regulator [Candidatus Eremiobacteraeota bacterium]